jgi:exodeoxyribonuclease VII large subunit
MGQIVGMGPTATLRRGFAIVRSEGKPVTSANSARLHVDMEIEYHDGRIAVTNHQKLDH